MLTTNLPVSINSIIKAVTINMLFVPTLTEEGSKLISALIVQPDVSWSMGCAVKQAERRDLDLVHFFH